MQPISAILFDLDGTLVDTAPDLAFALNTLLQEQGQQPLPFEQIRPVASHGSPGLLDLGFGLTPNHPEYTALQQRFLELYQENIARETALFEGMREVIEQLEDANIAWGIITNKPAFLTEPLLIALGLIDRAACVVSGDTTAYSKPHPAPMLHACELIKLSPEACIYIGDAERDIEAAKNANMQSILARYGYLGSQDDPESWQADAIIDHPREILQWI
ncbi:MAG: phosphoglycolate phosphatase [Gammaproteobacteria bacterium]|nr:phosphoglycolate phosphatase [Gammaproteobacteria bacterium]MDH5592571.1 phosphoglycolate phosphatase [Gammaproteobacteria bacterium]